MSSITIAQEPFIFPYPHFESNYGQRNAPEEVKSLFIRHIPNYPRLQEIALIGDQCIVDGNLHFTPSDLKGYSAVKGKDGYGRQFVAYCTKSRVKEVECVNVLFQRYTDSTQIVSSCYTRGHHLGHDQLFSATPDIETAKETIKSLLKGTHPNWKF